MPNFTSDYENHQYTAKLRADANARLANIEAAVNAAAKSGLVNIRMHHGAVVSTNIQNAVIVLNRRDAVSIVNPDGSEQTF